MVLGELCRTVGSNDLAKALLLLWLTLLYDK